MTRLTACLLLLLCVCAAGQAAPPVLAPAPQALKLAQRTMRLPALTYACEGETSPPVQYAMGLVVRTLGPGTRQAAPGQAAVRLVVAPQPGALATAAVRLNLPSPPPDRAAESYVLDCGLTSPSQVVITGGPVGLIYGVHTLAQLLEQSPGRSLPRLAISDWPSFLTRAWTGIPRNPSDANTPRLLDWFARWRLNAGYYEIYGDAGQDSAPPEITELHRECARRGIALYGQISNWRTDLLLKRQLCACKPEDIAHIRRYCNELLDRGCDGLIFLFDDLTQAAVEHPLTCPECKARFSGLAEAQLELMRPMIEVARERGVKRLIVCPTPYYRGWQDSYDHKLPGAAYYAVWAKADLMQDVQVYHCLLGEKELAEVQKAGLRNYIYWYNGNREYEASVPGGQRLDGIWGGFTQLAFGWYGSRWDPLRGVVPLPDTYPAFRRLPVLTQHVWLCGGGEYPFSLWGAYCWNAERFDPDQAEHDLLQATYGPLAPADYARWRDVVRKWYPRLLAPPNGLTETARTAYLQELARDAAVAKEAAVAFQAHRRTGVGEDPAARMVTTADALAKSAANATTGTATARLDDWTEHKAGDATVRERKMELGDFWSRYTLRYSQTTEADGRKHRTQWHFGSGLGMLGPSYRNWYDAGFADVLVNGQSLDGIAPEFRADGEQLVATWDTAAGKLTVRFSLQAGGLNLAGSLDGATPAVLGVRLFTIPGAGWGAWTDMDKVVITAGGETPHGTPVTLGPTEDWLFLADRTYDLPHENAEGPCAAWFGTPRPAAVRCDNANYVVQIDADYPTTRQFNVTIWDFHGQQNAAALEGFKTTVARLRAP